MNVEFATCCKKTAIGYLKKVYPEHQDKIVETVKPVKELLELVNADKVRIQDPFMYGNRIAIVPGNKMEPGERAKISLVCSNFVKYIDELKGEK